MATAIAKSERTLAARLLQNHLQGTHSCVCAQLTPLFVIRLSMTSHQPMNGIRGVAKGSPVLVMYMAMKHAHAIADKLLAAGRSPDEPIAFVCSATTADMQVHETTLGNIGDLKELGLAPPAIVVLGEVVRLRSALDWMGAMEGRILTADPLGLRSVSKSA